MARTSRERNPRGSGSRLREEIIDSGIRLIDESDDAAVLTLRGVARAAGIAAPSVYPHFADLQAVTEAVLERSFSQLETTVAAAMSAEKEPAAGLFAGCSAYVQFGWDHRSRYRLMFSASGFAPNAVNTYTLIEQAIIRCVDADLSESTDPHADTFLVWASMHGIAMLERPSRTDYLRLGPIDRQAAVHTLVRRLARLSHE